MSIKYLLIIIGAVILTSITIIFVFTSSDGLPSSCDEVDLTDRDVRKELAAKGEKARDFIMWCDHSNATKVRPITGADSKLHYPN